jgi:hypothetical protein
MAATCGHSHVKYIVLLRDPVERAYSNAMMRFRGKHHEMETDNVTEYIMLDLERFWKTDKRNPDWAKPAASNEFPQLQLAPLNLVYVGLYYFYLREWFYYHGIDNMRIYFTEEFSSNTETIVRDAMTFIGLDDTKWQPTAEQLATVANARDKSAPLPPEHTMTPRLVQMLRQTFKPYNRKLQKLLNVTLPWTY